MRSFRMEDRCQFDPGSHLNRDFYLVSRRSKETSPVVMATIRSSVSCLTNKAPVWSRSMASPSIKPRPRFAVLIAFRSSFSKRRAVFVEVLDLLAKTYCYNRKGISLKKIGVNAFADLVAAPPISHTLVLLRLNLNF